MQREFSDYYPKKCPECGNNYLVYDDKRAEITCGKCGLEIEDDLFDMRPEWRVYFTIEKNHLDSKLTKNKKKIRIFLDSILGNILENIDPSDVPSLGKIGRIFDGIDAKSISNYIQLQYLPNKFEPDKISLIYNKFWSNKNPRKENPEKKFALYQFLDNVFESYKRDKRRR